MRFFVAALEAAFAGDFVDGFDGFDGGFFPAPLAAVLLDTARARVVGVILTKVCTRESECGSEDDTAGGAPRTACSSVNNDNKSRNVRCGMLAL